MIENFSKVTKNLCRGGQPSINDVFKLKNKLNISRIISLDLVAGQKIERPCKILNIDHVMKPIDIRFRVSVLTLFKDDLLESLNEVPTFIHCQRGKDRTGCAIALFRIKNENWPCTKALKEADKFGFGIGVRPSVVQFYKKLMEHFCTQNHAHISSDSNSASDDIVSLERSDFADFVGNSDPLSWSPYEDYRIRQFPYTDTSNFTQEQYDSRESYRIDDTIESDNKIPQSGSYDNVTQGINGAGPSLVGSGYV